MEDTLKFRKDFANKFFFPTHPIKLNLLIIPSVLNMTGPPPPYNRHFYVNITV